ncbi:MAG: excinuclease ABC subunit C [Micavibrio sp.]|nr:excinuclease ABC subunit C [Micavibrio sp.]
MDAVTQSMQAGADVIRHYLKQLPDSPGVYRMLNEQHEPIYIGKARSLKKRVVSYTHVSKLPMRLKRMVAETVSMVFVTTHTEVEALLLEANLIKKYLPRYNILLKDGKSFPYLMLTKDHDFPLLKKHRGAQKQKGHYYGPYPSASAVNEVMVTIQKAFQLRNCTDSFFATRKRPCLQYHIKRCTAPCVGYVSKAEYAEQVKNTRDFLEGKSVEVRDVFTKKMQEASEAQSYELAASYRDRIRALSAIQAKQGVNIEGLVDADIMAISKGGNTSCIQVFFIRAGQNLGNKPYFLGHDNEESEGVILESFILQFYANKPIPDKILLSRNIEQKTLTEQALSEQRGKKIALTIPQKGQNKMLIDWVSKNADEALERHLAEKATQLSLLKKVQDVFDLPAVPQRIEVYDNSHISGTNMVGGMIVAGPEGFDKKGYRKFNIKKAAASDDFAMMREVLTRRFNKAELESLPDLILIDGGKGQLSAVKEALEEIGVWGQFAVVAISKGPDRNAGREEFHIDGRSSFTFPINDPVLYYLQRLRDEVHRFAITTHRAKRSKDIQKSPLDELAGIGAKRKKALLLYFGSAKAVARAGVADLQKVDGISANMAEKIYTYFNQ